MSRYVKKSLNAGEEVVIKAKKSWWYITWPSVLLVGAVVALVLLIPIISDLAETVTVGVPFIDDMLPAIFQYVLPILLGVVLGLLTFIPFYRHLINFLTMQLVLTNKRIISKVGFFRIRSMDIPLSKVDHIEIRSSIIGDLLRCYELQICSISGTDVALKKRRRSIRNFYGVTNAKKFREALQNSIEQFASEDRKMQAQEIALAMRGY